MDGAGGCQPTVSYLISIIADTLRSKFNIFSAAALRLLLSVDDDSLRGWDVHAIKTERHHEPSD